MSEAGEKGLLYYFKAAGIILGVLITVTSIYAAAFKFVYGDRSQAVDITELQECYADFQQTIIDSISVSNSQIRDLKIDFAESEKEKINDLKLMNQKINAIIDAVPNNNDLVKKINDIHYFYQQWTEDEKKNSMMSLGSKQSSISTQ